MNAILIPIHSITSLITNSSTTIYTYSDSSLSALKSMFGEIFKVFGVNKTCDEVFKLVVMCDEDEYTEDMDEDDEDNSATPAATSSNKRPKSATEANEIVAAVAAGKMEKPAWMITKEEKENYSGYTPATYLKIIPLAPEYAELADKVRKFLYSTGHEAFRDG
jgi:hypothetical protein